MHGIEFFPQDMAVGELQGTGLAEHARRDVKAKTRTLKKQVEELHQVELSLIFGWWSSLQLPATDCVGAAPWHTVQARTCGVV